MSITSVLPAMHSFSGVLEAMTLGLDETEFMAERAEPGATAESLSYEAALRRGKRPVEESWTEEAGDDWVAELEAKVALEATMRDEVLVSGIEAAGSGSVDPRKSTGLKRCLISLRLSEVESERVRKRAIESGLSMSAYIRSCVLDAEALRSLVKQALAEIRELTPEAAREEIAKVPPVKSAGQRRGVLGWVAGCFGIRKRLNLAA